jgi:hypothetical protein
MEKISFEALLERLIFAVNARIKNGEYTERGLARILGISQPQMHNVLKGARTLGFGRPVLMEARHFRSALVQRRRIVG